jgi:hypothetical protein
VIALLKSPLWEPHFLSAITNLDGYAVWSLSVPFTGTIQLAGAAQYYEQPVSVSAANMTLRIGNSPSNPQDLQLPPCVPFKRGAAVTRPPLPPFPSGSYDRTLPWEPPKTRDFLRADAWGVEVPGLPIIPRGSSEHPERFLTYLDYRYSRSDLQRGLAAHAARGYTHWVRSWPDARSDGGQSVQQFVDDCRFIKQCLPYIHVKLASKDFDPRDQTLQQWQDRVEPVMSALIAAKVVDEFGVFEFDLYNVPGEITIQTFKWMGQKAHAGSCSFWAHFSSEKTSWFADGDPRGRFGFWDDLGSDVDGLDYQTGPFVPAPTPDDPHPQPLKAPWTIEETQARLVDTLKQFAMQGNQHKMRLGEDMGWLQFSLDRDELGQPVNEDQANLRGYLCCCTNAPAQLWGYGGGGRLPDGKPL